MSSKKVASKETKSKKAPAKPAAKQASKPAAKSAAKKPAAKTAAKSAAPAKKSAPAKKPAAPAKKSAPAKKPTAPAKKSAPAKKPAAPVKKVAPAKKPAAPAKNTSKAAAEKKVATKAKEQVKTSAKQSPKTATKQSSKAVEKSSSATKAKPSVKPEPKPVSKNEEKTAVKGKKTAATAKVTETVEVQATPVEPVAEEKAADRKKNAPDYAYAVLLQGVKRLSKTIMFVKVDESEDRANKKKMSSDVKNLDMKPTSALRHKASLAEETQEELTERILKELEEQNKMFEREVATQMCTRCNRNLVSPEFWVDKHLGFCEECAAILKLGQSKEARKVEYQLGAMDGDSLDEEDDDIIGPDADDLKEAEEDLAEMDD